MKLSIGDKVRFLNEKGEGVVSRIINKTTVAVTVEDGFEIPFLVSSLVKVQAAEQEQPQKQEEQISVFAEAKNRKKEREGIYAAVSPEKSNDIAHTDFNLWLINHTSYEIMYICSKISESGFQVFDRGEARPYESKIVATMGRKELDDYSNVKIETLFYNVKKFEHRPPVSEIIKIKQARLYKENAFASNELIPEKALLINVSHVGTELFFDTPEGREADLSQLLFQKKNVGQAPRVSKPHTKNDSHYEMEIDLHIEELIDNYAGMSNAEIVTIQLRHFQRALDEAISAHCRSLTVIHGVGNGRLKSEVRRILSESGLRYHDASYARYGFGATEVVF
jgi:hypothetical protein